MSEYVDDELSPRQRRRIERHADLCPECGPLRRALLRLTAALRDLRSPPDPSITATVIRRLRENDRDAAVSGGAA
jgi:anti-sigma factor RsiW